MFGAIRAGSGGAGSPAAAPVPHADRAGIVRIGGIPAQFHRFARPQRGDGILAPLKADADDLGVETARIADRRVRIARRIGRGLGVELVEEARVSDGPAAAAVPKSCTSFRNAASDAVGGEVVSPARRLRESVSVRRPAPAHRHRGSDESLRVRAPRLRHANPSLARRAGRRSPPRAVVRRVLRLGGRRALGDTEVPILELLEVDLLLARALVTRGGGGTAGRSVAFTFAPRATRSSDFFAVAQRRGGALRARLRHRFGWVRTNRGGCAVRWRASAVPRPAAPSKKIEW